LKKKQVNSALSTMTGHWRSESHSTQPSLPATTSSATTASSSLLPARFDH